MRFDLTHRRCCPSALLPGEAKRIPKNPLHPPVGFYVGCPGCGRPQTITAKAIDEATGQTLVEEGLDGELVSFEPGHTCSQCGVRFRAERGEIRLLA